MRREHPNGVGYWNLFINTGESRLFAPLPNFDPSRFRHTPGTILVSFIDEQNTGQLQPLHVYVDVSWWLAQGFVAPSWAAFQGSDRVMSTSAGILLGLLRVNPHAII